MRTPLEQGSGGPETAAELSRPVTLWEAGHHA